MSFQRIILETRATAQEFNEIVRPLANDAPATMARLAQWVRSMGGGVREGEVEICYGMVCAVGTIVFTDQPNDNETLRVGSATFTAQSAGAGANEWNIVSGGTAAADANGNAVLVAALINEHASLSKYMVATVSAGTVTVTMLVPGEIGLGVTLEEGSGGMTNCTVTGFSSGSDGTTTDLALGSVS